MVDARIAVEALAYPFLNRKQTQMNILVSGAGIAGLAVAGELGAAGHDVTVVERADHLRTQGSPIDIRGDAIDIARQMGILTQVAERRVAMTELTQFVDAQGQVIAALPGDEVSDSEGDLEIPRAGLAQVLLENLRSSTELRFGDSIERLQDDGRHVDVALASGRRECFDLVVGADGLHSSTRRLVFGPEADFLNHLGYYVALTQLPTDGTSQREGQFLNWPGHMIGITRYDDVVLGVMNFRSSWIEYDHRDLDAQRRILVAAFGEHREWRVPEILDAACHDPELYFDSVSQIHMFPWHRGRVVLVGDAAYCASGLSGRGASLAVLGGWFLARALDDHPANLEKAFEQYERVQRPYVVAAQDSAGPGGDLVVPETQRDLDARNQRLQTLRS